MRYVYLISYHGINISHVKGIYIYIYIYIDKWIISYSMLYPVNQTLPKCKYFVHLHKFHKPKMQCVHMSGLTMFPLSWLRERGGNWTQFMFLFSISGVGIIFIKFIFYDYFYMSVWKHTISSEKFERKCKKDK